MTSDTRPVLLLDIDGVINATTRNPYSWPKGDWVQVQAGGFTIRAATPVLTWLTNRHLSGIVEIQWHTTWQQDAWKVGEALGLPEFEVCAAPEYTLEVEEAKKAGYGWVPERTGRPWWKLPAALRVLEAGRPLIWCDDDISYDQAARKALGQSAPEVPRCAISPSSSEGLRQVHLDSMGRFLSDH